MGPYDFFRNCYENYFFLFVATMRPSSETGARPKTSVTSPAVSASTCPTTANGQDQAEREEGTDDDDHVRIALINNQIYLTCSPF